MCGRVIQSSELLRYAIVKGMDVRDARVHNYPPRWNAAPSQDLLTIRRNHGTGDVLSRLSCGPGIGWRSIKGDLAPRSPQEDARKNEKGHWR